MELREVEGQLSVTMVSASNLSQSMHPDDLDLAKQVISWRLVPDFPKIGRTAWVKLAYPFAAQCGKETQIIRSLKLKGVGMRDHHDRIHRPSNAAYRRPDAHLGIDDDGAFCDLWAPSAPLGALAFNRAVVEYTTAHELSTAGPISEVPLLLYRYSGLEGFRDDSGSVSDLAVIVAGLPADTPARADCLVHYARQSPTVQTALGIWARSHAGGSEFNWTTAQLALWREYGTVLRAFHNRGFYRHNAHPSNLGVGPHGVFLTDLDSTRHMLECPPRVRALQALRDVAGAVFHIIADTIRSEEMDSVEGARKTQDALVDAFLNSYFPEVPRRVFEDVKAVGGSMTRELWGKWVNHFDESAEAGSLSDSNFEGFVTQRHSQSSWGVDAPVLFCRLVPGLATPYSLSRAPYHGGAAWAAEVTEAADVFLRYTRGRRARPTPA